MTTADSETDQAKQAIRERVWALLDAKGAVQPPGAHGHIPSFVGADQAADQLADLPAWQAARTIKVNPDKAQLPVRARALADGKTLYMAVPKLRASKMPTLDMSKNEWLCPILIGGEVTVIWPDALDTSNEEHEHGNA